MDSMQDIASKRWFMGKGRKIDSIETVDRVAIGETFLSIVRVNFAASENCEPDLYAVIEDETRTADFFYDVFSCEKARYGGTSGEFMFMQTENFPVDVSLHELFDIAPLDAEQSNSAFASEHFFFKLYRRLLPGIHPEVEIMEQLDRKRSGVSPQLYGTCYYADATGKRYTLGILEERATGMQDAWAYFNSVMDAPCAEALGIATAKMHRALRGLPGTPAQNPEIPFDKLEHLLNSAVAADAVSADISAGNEMRELAEKVKATLPKLKRMAKDAFGAPTGNEPFTPQRIHGDYHLGQVLVSAADFKILDFEGEPTRSLEYRRALRSPLVDVAGMLRSFQYAGATSGFDCTACEKAFLEGYAQAAHVDAGNAQIDLDTLERAATLYILAKAVYEACYELEFRPGWFHIPARALLKLAD
ncbi:MAG: phosphotransferase [Fibrobacter sp.]|uniref:phosphotransferase n=1 Tax=Fibrobacter sp. TaxID=35828 RepID=UPI0025B89171|nr:phosphotransferase [Fibrobacter sp.]MBQ9224988.1 phosphotransferase [Fibrobacter sp.]